MKTFVVHLKNKGGFIITIVNLLKSPYKVQKCHCDIYYISFLITDVDLAMLIHVFVVVEYRSCNDVNKIHGDKTSKHKRLKILTFAANLLIFYRTPHLYLPDINEVLSSYHRQINVSKASSSKELQSYILS